MMYLTPNFTLEEMILSQEAARRGLSNKPSAAVQANLKALCVNVLQPLRNALGRSIVVSSGYRSPAVNKLVGGVSTSQHCKGQAADIICPGMSTGELIKEIQKLALPVDQCINEFAQWAHVSYNVSGNRNQYLTARRVRGQVVYSAK